MNMVLVLPAAALLGIVLNLVFYRFRRVRAVLSTLIFLGLFALTFALRELIGVQVTTGFSFLGQELGFTLTPLGFYFLLMINGITLLTSVFSLQSLKGKSRHEGYYLWLFLKTFGMTGVVLASDFLTLFILWEVMTWSTFFLMQQTGGRSRAPAFKYLVYAIASSMMLLLAIAAVYTQFGTFAYGPIAAGFSGLPLGMLVFLSVVLVGAFAVEAAVYPFHGWVPESYASTFT
ncbi:MAG: hypothetical protein K9L29_11075, partial [Spirochaetales bacterium]|nr:hypothetical protein [Spirochaetales bacterium]